MTEQVTLQKALIAIKKLKNALQNQEKNSISPIAIIGLSCRFPNAIGKNAFWKLLSEGRNVIEKIPEERWKFLNGSDEIYLRDENHPYWGGYLSGIDQFDPYFFGISPREALRMDPQHRLLLEVAYEAFEDAGLPVESLAGSNTGVFSSLYISQLAHMQEMESELDALFLPTGNAISIAANRISYLFDLHGPSMILDSACSSSMVGLHIACLNLQNKLCDTALVCGAKLNLLPYINFVLSKAKMLSPDGQCKTFDETANGYVQGEGVGAIILKPLEKALEDHDRIYAVIAGSAVNQDGKTNGLTAPNGLQQEFLLKTAYQTANINPLDISYVECHGTGTFLGDPIEIQALGEVLGKKRDKDHPCWIGSVKTNIGHLEPAAGVASIIKVVLSLYHGQIPPHLNFSKPNTHIDFNKYHFSIPRDLQSWPVYGNCRLAGISGFGFGGTNAHVVLRELTMEEKKSDASAPVSDSNSKELFTLSAKDPQALKILIERWVHFIEANPALSLPTICYNLHLKRSHYTHRLAIISNTIEELKNALLKIHDLEHALTKDNIFINFKNDTLVSKKISDELFNMNLSELADLYVRRANINWKKFEENRHFPYVDLPLYPWQHKSYWPKLGYKNTTSPDSYPLQGKQLYSPLNHLQFEFIVDAEHLPDIKDTYNVFHAGYYMEALTFITQKMADRDNFTVENLTFTSPLFIPDATTVTIQVILESLEKNRWKFHFYSNINGQKNWVQHANGDLLIESENEIEIKKFSISEIKQRCSIQGSAQELYQKVTELGMPAGDSIRWTNQFWAGKNEILCEFQQPKAHKKNTDFKMKIHPGIIDASIQPVFMLLPKDTVKPYIADHVNTLNHHGIQNGPYFLFIQLKEIDKDHSKIVCDSFIIDRDEKIVFEGRDISLTQLDNKIDIQNIVQLNSQEKIDLGLFDLPERKQKIIEFIITQVSTIFAMPKNDVDIHVSLKDFGIDSLMALVLMRSLEIGLNTSYSMQDLLSGPTISELAETIANDNKYLTQAKKDAGNWIAYRKKNPKSKIKLFCFPYGGGGASIYRDWQDALPDHIEVCPVQLPGREDRMNELPSKDIKNLTNALINELLPEFDTPFAFFGHSFGSLIAFELGHTLRERALAQPIHLFASAFPGPHTPTKSLDNLITQINHIDLNLFELTQEALQFLSHEKLTHLAQIFNENGVGGYGDHLLDKDVIKVLLPVFIGDMSLVKSYQYTDLKPLDIPITVFAGKKDTWVSYEDHLSWEQHTTNKCEVFTFDSGHLFIRDAEIKKNILQTITNALGNNIN
jgi:surfactin synthase thioesterase subunit/3-oxoacyl-(acyl-carrier-protein) synthase/acyl carrier protein